MGKLNEFERFGAKRRMVLGSGSGYCVYPAFFLPEITEHFKGTLELNIVAV